MSDNFLKVVKTSGVGSGSPVNPWTTASTVGPVSITEDAALDSYETVERRACRTRTSDLPLVHRLVHEYDLRGVTEHLKQFPDDVHLKIDGDTPLHRAAKKGAVLVAENIGAHNPNHRANNAMGLWPAYDAALNVHDQTAGYLFEQVVPGNDGPWKPVEEIEAELAEFVKATGSPDDDDFAILASGLIGLTRAELDSPDNAIKWVGHLEGLQGSMEVVQSPQAVKLESWWQKKFLAQRVRALVTYIVDEDLPKDERAIFVKELSVTCDALRLARRLESLRKLNSFRVTSAACGLESKELTARALELKPNEEIWMPVGWKGHAIYLSLRAVEASAEHPEDTILVRIDNVGAGNRAAHDRDADGLIESRSFHLPKAWLQGSGQADLSSFLKDVLTAKAKPVSDSDDFYSPVARLKTAARQVASSDLVESRYGLDADDAQPGQIAGNCTAENAHRGLRARLATPERNDKFRTWELNLANRLVGVLASPQRALNVEREARDRRELVKAVNTGDPTKVVAFIENLDDSPHAHRLAQYLTIEDVIGFIDVEGAHAMLKLLDHGLDPELRDDSDRTLLHLAARANCPNLVKALLDRGVSLHAMDKNGDTPLHLAAQESASASVHVLFERDADPDRENKSGMTARQTLDDNMRLLTAVSARLNRSPGTGRPTNQRGAPV